MPSELIEVRKQYTQAQEIALMEAVHSALREAFKILPCDRNVRPVVHEPHVLPTRNISSATRTSALMRLQFASLDAERNLYRAIVTNLKALGTPRNHVMILLRENCGIRGGQTGCDVEPDFKAEV